MTTLFTNGGRDMGTAMSSAAVLLEVTTPARFPSTFATNDYWMARLDRSEDAVHEFVKVTAYTAGPPAVFTIERAQEGTTALTFETDFGVSLHSTAGYWNTVMTQDGAAAYATSTVGGNTQEVALDVAPLVYRAGLTVLWLPFDTAWSGGGATLDVNGLGAMPIYKVSGSSTTTLTSVDLQPGVMAKVIMDGTAAYFMLMQSADDGRP